MSEETKVAAKSAKDYVKEAYECFLKDKPNDAEPLAVIREFYEANASAELKAKCAEEGKTIEGAYAFMCEVAQKAGGKSISDSVGLSVCMHYFQDVPPLADFEPALKQAEEERQCAKYEEEAKRQYAAQQQKAKAEKAAKKKAKAAPAANPQPSSPAPSGAAAAKPPTPEPTTAPTPAAVPLYTEMTLGL